MQTLKEVTDSIDRQNKLQNMEEEIKSLRQQNAELVELMQATVDYTGAVVSTNNFYFAPTPKATGGE